MKINNIDVNTVNKISKLAKIKIKKNNLDDFVNDFKKILNFLNCLNEPNNNKIASNTVLFKTNNFFREDREKESLLKSEVFQNIKKTNNNYFFVPQIIINKKDKR